MKFWNLVGQAYGLCSAYCGQNFESPDCKECGRCWPCHGQDFFGGDHLVQPSSKIFKYNIYIYLCLFHIYIYIFNI